MLPSSMPAICLARISMTDFEATGDGDTILACALIPLR